MKISELKPIIKNYDKSKLESIVVELYKRVPKNIKEDYNIDNYIININNESKSKTKKTEEFDLDNLKDEILYFLSCVDNGFYHIPNRVIPKKERSSWRFKVKKYYKYLTSVDPTFIDGDIATLLLIEIFKRLSEGTTYLLFSNWEPFNAIGISQDEYFREIFNRVFKNKVLNKEDRIKTIVDLLNVESNLYHEEDLYSIYSELITDEEDINISIRIIQNKIVELKEAYKNIKSNSFDTKYYLGLNINYYIELVTSLYIKLNQIETGINFYYKNVIDLEKTRAIINILHILEKYKLYNRWIEEYEKNSCLDSNAYIKQQYIKIKNELEHPIND